MKTKWKTLTASLLLLNHRRSWKNWNQGQTMWISWWKPCLSPGEAVRGEMTSLFLLRLLREEEVRFHLPISHFLSLFPLCAFPFFQTNRFCHLVRLLHHRYMPQCCQTSQAVHKPLHSHNTHPHTPANPAAGYRRRVAHDFTTRSIASDLLKPFFHSAV